MRLLIALALCAGLATPLFAAKALASVEDAGAAEQVEATTPANELGGGDGIFPSVF